MKHLLVHYKNKYPSSIVRCDENSLSVHSENGLHLVQIVKDGYGNIKDVSKEYGCHECHDLSPIAKEARIFKLHVNGEVGLDELHEERQKFVDENLEYNEKGYRKVGQSIEVLAKPKKAKK